MKQKNIFLGNNIKLLRQRQRLTQEGLAEKLGMSRSKINCIEIGQTKSPALEDLLHFARFFKMSLDTLVQIDLSKLGELKIRSLEAGSDVYIQGGALRVLAISVDTENNEQVEYVPFKAKAGYATGYKDSEYIASLERHSVPNLPRNGTFRIFATQGDSMLPIPEGSDIIARYETDWTQIKAGTPCIVILNTEQSLVFKLVSVQPDAYFLLSSLNPAYQPYQVHASEILEIWSFYAFTSKTIPAFSELSIVLQAIKDLKQNISKKK